jgi:hypothetical protein
MRINTEGSRSHLTMHGCIFWNIRLTTAWDQSWRRATRRIAQALRLAPRLSLALAVLVSVLGLPTEAGAATPPAPKRACKSS